MDSIKKLIRFCGYGNFASANVVFLGNEEGLGGGEISDEIRKRTKDFWDEGIALDGINKERGYYVSNKGGGDAKGHFLLFCARLMLHLNRSENKQDYFQKQTENAEAFKEIKSYKINSLFNEDEKLLKYRSVLIDFRPLPRVNEKTNSSVYTELNADFDWKQYIKAFRLKNRGINKFHYQMLHDRTVVLKTVFSRKVETKVIIGIGDKEVKKMFFEKNFEFEKPFEEKYLSKDKVEVLFGIIRNHTSIIPVFLSNFFQSGYGIGLDGLKELCRLIDKELVDKNPLLNDLKYPIIDRELNQLLKFMEQSCTYKRNEDIQELIDSTSNLLGIDIIPRGNEQSDLVDAVYYRTLNYLDDLREAGEIEQCYDYMYDIERFCRILQDCSNRDSR
jgi:hypothetical protein